MEMTVNRGLAELKLLDSRIIDAISKASFVTAKKESAKTVVANKTKDMFFADAKSDMQSIKDLIKRRDCIKSAIVDSNAVTSVVIGEETMSVASAIERKASIKYDKYLLDVMRRQYASALAKLNSENEKVQQKLDELLIATFGKDKKAGEDELKAVSIPYLSQNQWEFVDPLKLEEQIKELDKRISDFESQVDFVLTESNCATKIIIAD